jgi:hypothetical protein
MMIWEMKDTRYIYTSDVELGPQVTLIMVDSDISQVGWVDIT